jgi:hypothetical protein
VTAPATGFPAERFVSKRDGWLVAVLWAAISPLGKAGFLRALGQRAAQLELLGESVRQRT